MTAFTFVPFSSIAETGGAGLSPSTTVASVAPLTFIEEKLPILYSLFKHISNPTAYDWTLKFAQVGIIDAHFPVEISVFHAQCLQLGIEIHQIPLNVFDKLQRQYFARPVQQGEHIEYPHKSSPYQKVFTPGFPVSGTFGEVDKVSLYNDPTRVFSRKRLLHFEERRHAEAIKKEIRLLQTFRHEHSVPYYGSYVYQNQLYLVFEFCDGNLDDFFCRSPSWFSNLSEGQKANKIVNWIIDILSGIAAFHGGGGIHRDLKPQNILIKGNTLYIADFGLAKQERHLSSNPHSVHGTEKYMAPEQGKNMKYGRASDVFALGCICLELLIFGENININFFNEFRKHFGSRTCQYSGSSCYRHNLAAVSKFIAKYLRQNPVTEDLLDVIEFDLLNENPLLRISARNARTKILKITSSWGFFKKEECCSGEIGTSKFQDASMKSLLDRVGSLSLQVDLDAMEIDMVSCVGQFQRGFWR